MKYIKLKHKKEFIGVLQNNKMVALSEEDRNTKKFTRIDQIEWTEQEAVTDWLKGLEFPVRLARQVFTNKDGSTGNSVSGLQSADSGLGHDYDNVSKTMERRGVPPQVIEIEYGIGSISCTSCECTKQSHLCCHYHSV